MNALKNGSQKATARVTLTAEITLGSVWGEDCSVKQVHESAVVEARNVLHRAVFDNPNIKIVDAIAVSAVIVTRE